MILKRPEECQTKLRGTMKLLGPSSPIPALRRRTCRFKNTATVATVKALGKKHKAAVHLKPGCFDNIDSAVIISSVSKAVQN